MKKYLSLIAAALLISVPALADQGMWLPSLIGQRIQDMQAKGFKLSAEDIYSVNQASLKDAVVLFGRGCTGEIVSNEGLLFTNHHCGYSQIQKHSSVEHDYLKDGFWAMSRDEELPNPGLTVSFLDRMEDVTELILKGYAPEMTEAERDELVARNSDAVIAAATAEGNGLRAKVEALYYGNQYFLFVYREFSDVRLVGAPPSSIGKFGGDTDNWMWPRHTGDFSIFRVYADKNNNPAGYSKDNVPYTPKRFFKISRAGVKEGDFTLVYGFPGSTKEYIHSEAVRYIAEISDPQKIALRTLRLDVQKKYMSQSQAVRIQYSSKNASVSNAWKKWQGEAKGLIKNHTVADKQAYEARFEQWAKGTQYEGLTTRFAKLYAELEPYAYATDVYQESAYTVEIARMAQNYFNQKNPDIDGFYKDYYLPIDKESFIAIMNVFDEKISDEMKPAWYKEQLAGYGSIENWAEVLFSTSAFRSKETIKDAQKSDPAYQFFRNMYNWYRDSIRPENDRLNSEITLLYRKYMKAQMEFEPTKAFFPDANLTLRVAYGPVAGYAPADGIWYNPSSTLKGIIEKDNPDIFDYNIPQALRDIYAEGGHDDQPVCFLAMNHTTGGNSGSPILNANGELIGLNFDRVWEGTMSDLDYDPEICRNIGLDVRYLLFIVKNIGHADHLFNEMVFAD
ncbi:MAG: S46 family peptidase [Bacteroidales bacterium]|nr:S46 family peptidase [Bacteroidales bacterium]